MMSPYGTGRAVEPPRMFGYASTSQGSAAGVERRVQELARYCASHDILLGSVFVDDGVDAESTFRAGFAALVDAVERAGRSAVVITDAHQLSRDRTVAEHLATRLRTAGSTVSFIETADGMWSPPMMTAPIRAIVRGDDETAA